MQFYREKPSGGERTKIGGAITPPTISTKPRKCCKAAFPQPGCDQVATPGGTAPGLAIFLYLVLDFSFQLLDLMKLPLIFGFNQLICKYLF